MRTAPIICLLVTVAACSVAGTPAVPDVRMDSGSESAPAVLPPDDAADAAALEAFVRGYADRQMFMGALLVSRRGVVLLDRAYGMANLEWDVPNTTRSRFRLGSISKQFTAAAILLLEEAGTLRVEDLLSKHLKDLPPAWASITIHQLLTHTSGIPDLVAFPEYASLRPQPSPPEKTYLLLRDRPLDFPPGQKFQYSNSGYVVLALLIERLTGKSYDASLRERVLAPLGLNDTGSDAPRPLLKNRADGYVPLTPPGADPALPPPLPVAYRNADFIDMSLPTGGGGLYSTTGDLQRWIRALFGGKLLSPASFAKMTTVHVASYGYGLFINTNPANGERRISHGGSIHGFLSSLTYYPASEVFVLALSNTTAGHWLTAIKDELEAVATHTPRRQPPPPPPADAGADDTRD